MGFPAHILRHPGLPPPGGNAPGGGGPGNDGPGGDAPGDDAPPANTPPADALVAPEGGNTGAQDDDSDNEFSDCTFTEEEWRVFEALQCASAHAAMDGGNANTPRRSTTIDDGDDEAHVEDLRNAIAASMQSYAQQLSSVRELSVEPIPSGSQGFPAQHVDPGTGATLRGTFVPNPVVPIQPACGQFKDGVWVFFRGQTPPVQLSSSIPRIPARQDARHRHGDASPSASQRSLGKGQGKGKGRAI